MWMTGLVTGALNVRVNVPRLEQRDTLTEQPTALMSMSVAFVVTAIDGYSMAAVTLPVELRLADAAKIAELVPFSDICIVKPPGKVFVTGPVPELVEGVWLAFAGAIHKASKTSRKLHHR